MTEETQHQPEPPSVPEQPPALEAAELPVAEALPIFEPGTESKLKTKPRSAAKILEAFLFPISERFSAALVLGLGAALLIPPPSAQESFAEAVQQQAAYLSPAPQAVEAPPIQLAKAETEASTEVKVRPTLKGRPKVTLKDKWAKPKKILVLRAKKDVPRDVIAILSADDLPELVASAPATEISVRTAKHATALLNAKKPEAETKTEPTPEDKPVELNIWPEETIKSARASCDGVLRGKFVKYRFLEPIKDGACGAPAPIALQSAGETDIAFQSPLTINCETAAALADWIDKDVQPAAKDTFGVPVKRFLSASSYSCRHRYGRKDAPWSEHATANAIDIFGFVLADGRTIKVADAWGPAARDAKIAQAKPSGSETVASAQTSKTQQVEVELMPRHPDFKRQQPSKLGAADIATALPKKSSRVTGTSRVFGALQAVDDKRSQFLKRIHGDACGVFKTVLGPEANNAHRDHLHLDMKPRSNAFCE